MIRSSLVVASRRTVRVLFGTWVLTALSVAALPARADDDADEAGLTKFIENNPEWAPGYNNRANFYLNRGRFDEAAADCSRAIRLDPKFAWAYNNRGVAYVGKRQFDRALADYDRATELNPDYTFPYNNRAVIWGELELHRKAVAESSRALELDPDYAVALVTRGEAFAELGLLRQAVADLTLAYCLDPEFGAYDREVIDTDPEKTYVDGTLASWTEEIHAQPNQPRAYVKRAIVYVSQQQLREAVADLRKADQLRAAKAKARKP